jgi:MFS family permease
MDRKKLLHLGSLLIFALAARASMAVKFAILPLHLASQSFSPIEIGLVAGVGNAVAMFFSPWAGVVSDRISQRKTLAISGMGIGVSLVLFAVVGRLASALAVATFLAISATFYRLVLIVNVAEVSGQRRASGVSLLNATNSVASGLGAVLAGWVADRQGYALAFPACALPVILVSTIAFGFGGWKATRKSASDSSPQPRPVSKMTLQVPRRIASPMLFMLCDMGVTVAWKTFLPVHLVSVLGWSATLVGGLIAAQNLTYSICQPLSAYLADRLGHKHLLAIGLSGYGILVSLVPLVNSTWLIYGLMVLSGVLASPIYPTSLALAADLSSKDERGTAMGFMMASSNLAGTLGSSVAGLLASVAAAPSAAFAYSFVPAVAVGLTSQLFGANRAQSKQPEVKSQPVEQS